MKVYDYERLFAGCQIKNTGKGTNSGRTTRSFLVSGSLKENGPWETLVEGELIDTRVKLASLLNFTFEKPVEIQFLKFELISYWGPFGGGLQYFAALPAAGKQYQHI